MKESTYIMLRRLKALGNSICFYLCRIFPIQRNLISVCTFEGKGGFGCNPKYLVMELHRQHPEYEFVWFVNDMSKVFPDYIRKVPNTVWSRAYWLSRSKVWIDNYRKPYGTVKRRGQYYLNVNHYTEAIKCTGLWRGQGFSKMAYLVSKNDSDMMDALVIDSHWCELASPKGLVFPGPYLKTGAPRCDVLYGTRQEQRRLLRQKHQLPSDARIVLYAPTFREGARNGKRSVFSEVWTLDFSRLLQNLSQRFGGTWYLCIRVHPQLAPTFREYQDEQLAGRIFDESQNDDMYQVLAGVDAYITDYSSAIFEAGLAGIPSFIYADDIARYAVDRGRLYWNMATDPHEHITLSQEITPQIQTELPFPVASDDEEMERKILSYDETRERGRWQQFAEAMGMIALDGRASKRLAAVIEQQCAGREKGNR